jgi:hypothetical protein
MSIIGPTLQIIPNIILAALIGTVIKGINIATIATNIGVTINQAINPKRVTLVIDGAITMGTTSFGVTINQVINRKIIIMVISEAINVTATVSTRKSISGRITRNAIGCDKFVSGTGGNGQVELKSYILNKKKGLRQIPADPFYQAVVVHNRMNNTWPKSIKFDPRAPIQWVYPAFS